LAKKNTQSIPPQYNVRITIEAVQPEIDFGRHPAKRTRGEDVLVTAQIFADGHDVIEAAIRHRRPGGRTWIETPMEWDGRDGFSASFRVDELGHYEYGLSAWFDRFATWRRDLKKKFDAGQDVSSELLEGAALVREAAERNDRPGAAALAATAARIDGPVETAAAVDVATSAELGELMKRFGGRHGAVDYPRTLAVVVEREKARYGAWYEMFPRSAGTSSKEGATFRQAEQRLEGIAAMGFDVLYLPPIHPIGKTHRKGPNNSLEAEPDDPGSPWAIGSEAGGHKAVEPALGTLADFERFAAKARKLGLEIALDLAFQCSPDHPYVREHPEWFRHRPDGSIKYAENPPKKYQDILPLDFECDDWESLWMELRDVVAFWIERGVKIFRVDNPHTKTMGFWEWMIDDIRSSHPDVVFLSEAFTRPYRMRNLAKRGFSQSYTYFTWRNTKQELTEYFTELTQTEVREYLRPNLFTNTPDILHEYLQFGGRAAFQARLVLAATLGASYGIYGPPFELCEAAAVPGSEEYRDSEKYQIRAWDWDRPGNIKDFIARVNRIRRENPALHSDWSLRFHPVENEELLFYSKRTKDSGNIILVVVNLDTHHVQSGWIDVPTGDLGLQKGSYQVHDLLSDARYLWHGARSFVSLDPAQSPAQIFRVRRKVKTERDFDYFI